MSADISESLDGLETVSLDELSDEGSLMTRTDRKYLVPVVEVPGVVRRLRAQDPGVRVLEVGGLRSHAYSSVYLDTPGLDGYWMSARRRRRRFKVRSREYVDSGLRFTEVKTRGARGTTVKNRVAVPGGRAPGSGLPEAHVDFVRAELRRAGLPSVDARSLTPSLRTRYRRSTLWLPTSASRITIDTELTWALPDGQTQYLVPDLAIVEVKTARAGTGVDRALWRQGHRPVRISKYGTGLGLVMADVPSHRWHRVLRRLEAGLAHTTAGRS